MRPGLSSSPALRCAHRSVRAPRRCGAEARASGNEEGQEIILGVRLYFDRALGKMLLYRFERQQYATLLRRYGANARMSDLYGGEHLLRLIGAWGVPRHPLA